MRPRRSIRSFQGPAAKRAGAARAALLLVVPALCIMVIYARFFDGFWLGDDFGNLDRAWLADRAGTLWSDGLAQFLAGVGSDGAFYRPVMIASLLVNEAIAGPHYAGWFAFNLIVHAANTVLVGALAMRLAAASGGDGRLSGFVAALFFALSPLLAEGVFWISARADACVTLLTLAGVYAWGTARSAPGQAMALPLLLLPALGFKESAAVLPLQMMLVALAWPVRLTRAQIGAIVACFVLVAAFFAMRAHLFGDAWQVYRTADAAPLPERARSALLSIVPWWVALTRGAPLEADIEVALAMLAAVLLAAAAAGARARVALALVAASAGLVAATLLNLGSLSDNGEGGRLAYSPIAWLALALGVAGARPWPVGAPRERRRLRVAGVALAALSVITGAFVLETVVAHAYAVERMLRTLTASLPQWAATHPGLTLLLVPDRVGAVVAARNAQAGMVLPPVQPRALLDRVLPTVPREIAARHDQLAAGLAARLAIMQSAGIDAPMPAQRPAAPRWPAHYACASPDGGIVRLPAPDPQSRETWIADLRQAWSRCEAAR